MDTLATLRSHLNVGSRDLSSKNYSRSLILICDLKFASNDQFEEAKQLSGLIRSDNLYVLPKEIKYDDYINSQFDELLKKKNLLPASGDGNSLHKSSAPDSLKKHMLIELEIQNLNSILRTIIQDKKQLYCLAAIEPLTAADSVKTYV